MNRNDESVSGYYSEIAEHELLGAEGEVALAKEIEEREIEVWREILTFAPLRKLVLATLEEREVRVPASKGLRKALRSGSKSSEKMLVRTLTTAAEQIRESDRDRIHLDAVLARVDQQPRNTAGLPSWRSRLRAAEVAASDSRHRFVNANLRLVVRMSRKYIGFGVPFDDLIQEGNIGLMKAVDRYAYRKGYRFSTYAGWWIRHAIGRAVANTSRAVRVPVHVLDMNQQIAQAFHELTAQLGRSPTNEEVAETCALSAEKVAWTRMRASNSVVSLDEELNEEGMTRLDVLVGPANDQQSALSGLLARQEVARVSGLLEEISPMQADVLQKRFGIGGDAPMTLQSIADGYGLSRERIRQIERKALLSLRVLLEKEDRVPSLPARDRHAAIH